MTHASIRITFDSDSNKPLVFERQLGFADLREPGGKEFAGEYLLSVCAMESNWTRFRLDLPDVANFMREPTQSFRPEDLFSGVYEDRINTRQMWTEISHVLLRVRVLLSKSRAYHDQEFEPLLRESPEERSLRWSLHLAKMEHFDLAVIVLRKVSELAARLVFERLGASLVKNLDRANPNWERDITWRNIKTGLADRVGNPDLATLPYPEYEAIRVICDDFLKAETGKRLWSYRNKVVHRISPSVDRADLHTHLEDREATPLVDGAGRNKVWTKTISMGRVAADYAFTDLYDDAVQALREYIAVLERLDAIPRFSPEAEPNRA
jgi:hypothetical protein